MRRPFLPPLLWALIAGCVMVWFLLFATDFLVLATTPVRSWLLPPDVSRTWFYLYPVLFFELPLALLAGLYAWVVFGRLRARGLLMVLALSVPWLIFCLVWDWSLYQRSNMTTADKLTWTFIFGWHKWVGRLLVPLSVWVVSKVSSDKVRGGV